MRLPGATAASTLSALFVVLVLAGCGAEVGVSTKPDQLTGKTVASRANTQLEKQNPQLTHGELTCDDVKYEVDATSRCLRTVVLDDGRLVRIGATVTIDRTTKGGHFKIAIDDDAQEFGLTGTSVLQDLSKQYAAAYKVAIPTGSCPPYLAGKVGTTMRCSLVSGKDKVAVLVTVTKVEPKTFATEYTFKATD